MKKIIITVSVILVLSITVSIVYAMTGKTEGDVPEALVEEVRHMEKISWTENPWPSYAEVVNKYGIHQNSKAELDVPIYYEEELLFNIDGGFTLNRDASFYYGLNSCPNEASAELARYPTDAIRIREDGTVYAVYDTDTGYRLYVFFESMGEDSTYGVTVGFPVVIGNMLSYQDFASLRIGDDISKVEDVDEVATLHKKLLLDVWRLDFKGAEGMAQTGHPCTSIHYLTDGILKIEYQMLEDRSLVISDIIYNKDYQITDALGRTINHKIEDADLP